MRVASVSGKSGCVCCICTGTVTSHIEPVCDKQQLMSCLLRHLHLEIHCTNTLRSNAKYVNLNITLSKAMSGSTAPLARRISQHSALPPARLPIAHAHCNSTFVTLLLGAFLFFLHSAVLQVSKIPRITIGA